MDPFLEFCRRGSSTYPYLQYDDSFIYSKDSVPFILTDSGKTDFQGYRNEKLLTFFQNISAEAVIATGEQIVLEWANPLTSVHKYFQGGEDFSLKVLKRIFGLGPTILAIPDAFRPVDIFKTHFLGKTFPKNIIIRTPDILDSYWVHFVYLLSKLYRKVTILHPVCLKNRHIVCMGYTGDANIQHDYLVALTAQSNVGQKIYGLFERLPDPFIEWITFMNNTHLETRSEFFIHVVEARSAFVKGSFYWPGASYDILKAVNFISGKSTEPKVDIPPGLKFLKEIDHVVSTSMHLYGHAADFYGRALHKIIDVKEDDRKPYAPLKGKRVGGVHWGQRKLLLAELDFMTNMLEPDEKALVLYIGAAPWKHGPFLMQSFSQVSFVLFDPREDSWDPKVKELADGEKDRLILRSQLFDGNSIKEVVSWFEQDYEGDMKSFVRDIKKILIMSDIRKSSHQDSGFVSAELGVDEDMKFQKKVVEDIYNGLQKINVEVWSWLKFRLPFIIEIGGMEYKYGKGELHTQPWAPVGSTELRLWWNPKEGDTEYNKTVIEEIMMFHNNDIRSGNYGNPGFASYCPCHDCHYEIQIISKYLSKFKNVNVSQDASTFDIYVSNQSVGIIAVMGKSLADHSTMDRNKVSVPRPIWDYEESNNKKTLRYDPYDENLIFAVTSELKGRWKSFLEKQPIFKGRNVVKLIDDFLVTQLFLFGGFMPYKLDESKKAQFLLEFFNIAGDNTGIAARLGSILEEVYNSYYKDRDTYLRSKEYGKPVSARMEKLRKGGMVKLVSGGSGTVGFHKSLLYRFLTPEELEMNITDKNMKDFHDSVLPRAYCLLKRYSSSTNPHFHTYPSELFVKNPSLREGNILGLSTLNGKRDEKYMLLARKLDFYFNDDKYLNLLLENSTDSERILDHPTLLVFLPNIDTLWIKALEILLPLLGKYENQDKSIILLGHRSILQDNHTISDMIRNVSKTESSYEALFLNTLTNDPFRAESQYIIVLRTHNSTFELK